MERELPGLGEIAREVARRTRERPWAAVGIAAVAGYLLGGGFFTRPTRWFVRAGLGALAVPSVREEARAIWRRAWSAERRAAEAGAPF